MVADFAFDVTVLQPFTDEHPARIRASLTNRSKVYLHLKARILPYPGWTTNNYATQDTGRLFLIPNGGAGISLWDNETDIQRWLPELIPTHKIDDCWQSTMTAWDGVQIQPVKPGATPVPPGDTLGEEYTIIDTGRSDDCLPPGTHRTSSALEVQKSTQARVSPEEGGWHEVTVGFALHLTKTGDLSIEVFPPLIA